jgi:DNA mismatch repair protein MutL
VTIERLDEATVRRIAAGEVVGRPADVVRELVENAVDAGADRVEVAVDGGGRERVRVADDGHGIAPAEAPRAFERHATSKIHGPDDVDSVDSLGFRGEALAAVADAAGSVELVTRRPGGEAVAVVPGGEPRPAARAPGTTVTVTDLFADRPARRESLATPRTEYRRIVDLLAGYALATPDLAVVCEHYGTTRLRTDGAGDPVSTLLAVYDREVAGAAVPLEGGGRVAVEGVVCRPSVTRASAEHVHVAVNGRPLPEGRLRRAVRAGYGDLLPADRWPVAVVSVSVPPAAVDVNVHPAKREVAFADPDRVAAAVERAVASALATEDLTRVADLAVDAEGSLAPVEGDSTFADATVIGVYRELYVLCEQAGDLLVVDGHAAHERVNYERLRGAARGGQTGDDGAGDDDAGGDGTATATADGGVPSVSVDPPATLSLSPSAARALAEHRETVRRLGYRLSTVGDGTCRVEAVPAPLGRAAAPASLRDTLDEVADGDRPTPREDLLAELACHPSLSAGEFDRETATRLLDRLGACEQPYACPHGRPTTLSVAESTVAGGFDRPNTRFD